MSWLVNGSSVVTYQYQPTYMYPLSLNFDSSLDGATATVYNATTNPSVTNTFDVISTLSVSDVSTLDKATLQCQDISGASSEILNIQIGLLGMLKKSSCCSFNFLLHIASPPLVRFTSCSLHPSSSPGQGIAEVTIQWSTSFTSQYAVEKYRVSVNPDPSSCSSDQVSTSEDYSCSGLVLGTRYTFTVSAINCGDQEGEQNIFDTVINSKAIIIYYKRHAYLSTKHF